jgi:gliding-associated putative ABC transporter substrate-binding component GldG
MSRKRKNLFEFLLLFAIIIIVNLIFSRVHHRFDLTSDNRYTLKPKTRQVLKELDDVVYFKVYLSGEMPTGLKRMQTRIREMLNEFRVYAGDNIQYRFINPHSGDDAKERQALFEDLRRKGLEATNVKSRDKEGGYTQKVIFPGAVVNHGEKQTAVNLLKNNPGLSASKNLNHSIQALEYKLIDAVYKLTLDNRQSIAFVTGQGELDKYQVGDITKALSDYYQVDRVDITRQQGNLEDYRTLVVAKPRKAFSKEAKYRLDQYLMRGGSILWLIDRIRINMDSLRVSPTTMATISRLNLNDQLFKYGVRINPDLVKDVQCAIIPVNTAYQGDQPEFSPSPWTYFPLLSSPNNHPVNKNLNMIRTRFISSIDTLPGQPGVKKQILLSSSENSQTVQAPTMVDLGEVAGKPDPRSFRQQHLVTGVLLEGEFESVFTNRFTSDLEQSTGMRLREKSSPASMIVLSDGDMIRNEVKHQPSGTMISPLGYDKYTRQTYGNKTFLMNCIHYLANEEGLIGIRDKEVKMRLLDKNRVASERVKWQVVNVGLPILLIVVFGLVKNYLRRRKYRSF